MREVAVLLDADGEPAAFQFGLPDGGSIVCTDWTDWTLRLELRADSQIPDYLWPPEEYSRSVVLAELPADGIPVDAVRPTRNQVGELVGLDTEIGGLRLSAKCHGGEFVSAITDAAAGPDRPHTSLRPSPLTEIAEIAEIPIGRYPVSQALPKSTS
ncbi:hypothetical protein ABT026_14420 [Streptomyces sp. NPDC002734]|uniref:hypothetical protein n=1 Tax=Streptomyces sp. NPDC002734 TaxID=3154426 RepID=UPI0033249C17